MKNSLQSFYDAKKAAFKDIKKSEKLHPRQIEAEDVLFELVNFQSSKSTKNYDHNIISEEEINTFRKLAH